MPVNVIQLMAIVSTLESAGAGPDGLELTVTSAYLLMAAVRLCFESGLLPFGVKLFFDITQTYYYTFGLVAK